jgi:uncharacterized protein (TIGR03435 family)
MRKIAIWIAAAAMLPGGALHAQDKDISGNWQGTVQAGRELRTVVKITKDDGKYKGSLYSIDQGSGSIPLTSITVQGPTVNFASKPQDLAYAGTLNPDGNTISGRVTQHGDAHVLTLTHVTAENTWAIPEPPKLMPADAKPKFDVVTIKPSDPDRPGKAFTSKGRHMLTINTNLNDLITFAYGLHVKQIVGAPEWFATDKFDIDGVPDVEGEPSSQQFKMLFQSLLTERFGLKFHHDQKELSVYALTVAKSGDKLIETIHKPGDPTNFGFRKPGELRVSNSTMRDFCDGMQGAVMDKPVVDHTGLTKKYDFLLSWTPDESQFGGRFPVPPATDDPNAPPSLYTALQEQLGLKLEPTKAAADVIVIDHVEKPSAN